MPPNRKAQVADLPVGEDFSGFVKSSPYDPLTEDRREGELAQERHSTGINDDLEQPSLSNKDVMLQRIVREEWTRQLFSVEHITNNLIAEALKLKNGKVSITADRLNSIEYWTMSTAIMPKEHDLYSKSVDSIEVNPNAEVRTLDGASSRNAGQSWTSRAAKKRLIEEMLELERIRQLLAVEHIENNLIQRR